jgi:hypothetical protein
MTLPTPRSPSAIPRELLCIDPGATTGCAFFHDGLLTASWAKPFEKALTSFATIPLSIIVIEVPQVYRGPKAQSTPNDLLVTSYRAGRLAQAALGDAIHRDRAEIETVLPNAWKGTIPKPVHHKRVLSVLSSWELEILGIITPPNKNGKWQPDMLDAVGLGLWRLKRLGRGGVRP